MRKGLGIAFHIIGGFFVYMVCFLAFINQPPLAKWGMVAGFSLPALFFLTLGLAMNRFHRWRRDLGVVLLSGAGLTFFIVFTFVCLLTSEEFTKMMQPDSLDFFSAYTSGALFMLSVAVLGLILLKTDKKPSPTAGMTLTGHVPQ